MYIRSRAGLVALVFIQGISLVSAAPLPNPIPALQSGLSSSTRDNPSQDANDNTVDNRKNLLMARAPNADNDAQLVRRTSTSATMKQGFQKFEQDIKDVAQKVGPGIKKGANVVKFGLKVAQTAGSVVAKAISLSNPELGKPLQQAIEGYAKTAGAISDHIPVHLPPKLQKGEDIMDRANKVMSFLPRDMDEEDFFQQRDIGDVYYFEES